MPRRFPESGTQEEKVLNPSWKISPSESTDLAAKNSLAVLAKQFQIVKSVSHTVIQLGSDAMPKASCE